MPEKNIIGAIIARDPMLPVKIVGAVVIGGVVIYVGYKAYKFAEGVGKAVSSVLSPVKGAWDARPKFIFKGLIKGLPQGDAVMAGPDELEILGGLIR